MNKFQKELDRYFKKEGWKYWHPLSQFTRLVEETGELARILNHLYGEKPKKASELNQELEEEIGDVVYTLICLANSTGVDIDEATKRSLDKVAKRDKGRYNN